MVVRVDPAWVAPCSTLKVRFWSCSYRVTDSDKHSSLLQNKNLSSAILATLRHNKLAYLTPGKLFSYLSQIPSKAESPPNSAPP